MCLLPLYLQNTAKVADSNKSPVAPGKNTPQTDTPLLVKPHGKAIHITGVSIPDSVTSIGDYAFYGCEGLTEVVVPDGVTSIGTEAFMACDNLANVSIPCSVTEIGERAFPPRQPFFPDCTLVVTQGSYAEQYAKENGIPYVFTTE